MVICSREFEEVSLYCCQFFARKPISIKTDKFSCFSLELNGLKHDETSFIFKPSLVCGPNIDDLTVYYMSSDAVDGVSKRGLQSIFYACPNIRSLTILSKAWGVHMVSFASIHQTFTLY